MIYISMIEILLSSQSRCIVNDLLQSVRALYGAIDRFDAAAADKIAVDRSGLRAINLMETGAVSPGILGNQLRLASGSVTALLDRLENSGHIVRKSSHEDGRRRDASLTTYAHDQAGQIYAALGKAIMYEFRGANPKELEVLLTGIAKLAKAFEHALADEK
jgi:DNA-binding MarR family transcriptional regulator